MSLLAFEEIDARHGLLQAVRSVTLQVAEGETVALVGANGAGKTTLLRTIAGAHRPTGGRIVFDGRDITKVAPHRRVAMGITLVPEGRRLFSELTVEENLLVARVRGRRGPWTVDAVIDAFPMLGPLRKKRARTLSGGEQQATAIGRGLMTNPRLLLLDELSLGLAPVAVDGAYRSLESLIERGTTILLVEQDLSRAMKVSDRIVCMLEGRFVLEGKVTELTREQVTEAYFGLRRPAPNGSTP
ncbi:MAG TPA: ABC transporter ATP-binding protein [Gaiellaceae bacterium]|jgi:branched-chain amino acid transport system ATP-binding protein|nr:ABC transporter ATP-binding protein [Gaiellaceae bacterium]